VKKKLFKVIGITSFVIAFGGTTSVLAASKGSFSFSFCNNIVGSTDFSLAKKNTTCNTYAKSLRKDGSVLDTTFRYDMELEQDKFFGKSYQGDKKVKADGYTHTISFGTVEKSTYNVNIGTPDDVVSYAGKIEGKGELFQ